MSDIIYECQSCGDKMQDNYNGTATCSMQLFKPPCNECEDRARKAMEDLGRKIAQQKNAAVLKVICGE